MKEPSMPKLISLEDQFDEKLKKYRYLNNSKETRVKESYLKAALSLR